MSTCSRRYLLVVAAVLSGLATVSAKADGKPAIVQAEALLAEHDGDFAKALTLLRQAHAAAPTDNDIAFDRARIALEHPDVAQPGDLGDYLDIDVTTADQRLLRAYVLIARGRVDEARALATSLAQLDPGNVEATTLVEALSPAGASTTVKKSWAARFRLYGQYDTNVSVLPDHTATSTGGTDVTVSDATALQREAAGVGGEAELRWTPVRGITELSFLGGVGFLGHVNGRNDETMPSVADDAVKPGSKTYDYGTFDLQARLAFLRQRWNTTLELDGSAVFIDDYAQRYLTDGTFLASTSYALSSAKTLRAGAYGLLGLRSFGTDFDERSGQRFEGGLTLDYALRSVGIGVRGGYQTEQTKDKSFTEDGLNAMAYARASFGNLGALAALTYQHRGYATVNGVSRTDDRLGPQANLTYAITDKIAAIGSYLYIHNASIVHNGYFDYSYQRHLVTLGLEARL